MLQLLQPRRCEHADTACVMICLCHHKSSLYRHDYFFGELGIKGESIKEKRKRKTEGKEEEQNDEKDLNNVLDLDFET